MEIAGIWDLLHTGCPSESLLVVEHLREVEGQAGPH